MTYLFFVIGNLVCALCLVATIASGIYPEHSLLLGNFVALNLFAAVVSVGRIDRTD